MRNHAFVFWFLPVVFASLLFLLSLSPAVWAIDNTLRWLPAQGAEGYKIYQSTDNGTTWSPPVDVGNVTETTLTNVPESGLVLYKVSAYNALQETITEWQGAWFNALWMPPGATVGLGVK